MYTWKIKTLWPKKEEEKTNEKADTYKFVEGRPITEETFKAVAEKVKTFYEKLHKTNQEILDEKMAAARLWSDFTLKKIEEFGIPKHVISCVHTQADPVDTAWTKPCVYISFSYKCPDMLTEDKAKFEVFVNENDMCENSISCILHKLEYIRRSLRETLQDKA